MIKDYVTMQELVEILDIEEVSAYELLDGVVDLEADELLILAHHTKVSVEQLLR